MNPDLTGYIFEYNGSWWYITGLPRRSLGQSEFYPVVKCTSTGKKFKSTNGLSANLVLEKHKAGQLKYVGESAKVSNAGQQDGIRKRRISHIESEVSALVEELNRLHKELDSPRRMTIQYTD